MLSMFDQQFGRFLKNDAAFCGGCVCVYVCVMLSFTWVHTTKQLPMSISIMKMSKVYWIARKLRPINWVYYSNFSGNERIAQYTCTPYGMDPTIKSCSDMECVSLPAVSNTSTTSIIMMDEYFACNRNFLTNITLLMELWSIDFHLDRLSIES